MNLYNLCVVISSLSFLGYSVSYFILPQMKNEFIRFKMERLGLLTIILQLLGAFGLLVGLVCKPILLVSSGGLGILMLVGLWVRIKSKDSLLVSLPAAFLMILNFYIFIITLHT